MSDYILTLEFYSPGETLDSLSIRLYEQMDDASLMGPGASSGSFIIEADRDARSLPDALISIFQELDRILPEAEIVEVLGMAGDNDVLPLEPEEGGERRTDATSTD